MYTASHPALELGKLAAAFSERCASFLHRSIPRKASREALTTSLAHAEIRVLGNFAGGTVECHTGSVWLTHDGHCRDVVLSAGQRHIADHKGRLIVFALEASTVRLCVSSAGMSHT